MALLDEDEDGGNRQSGVILPVAMWARLGELLNTVNARRKAQGKDKWSRNQLIARLLRIAFEALEAEERAQTERTKKK